MDALQKLSDDLAKDTLEVAERVGDDLLVDRISETLGSSSATAQEAFLTSVRVRRAEAKARQILTERLIQARDNQSRNS